MDVSAAQTGSGFGAGPSVAPVFTCNLIVVGDLVTARKITAPFIHNAHERLWKRFGRQGTV